MRTALKYTFIFQRLILASFIIATICLALLFNSRANAQEGPKRALDITTSPTLFDLRTAPGVNQKNKIRLRNNSDTPVNLKLELRKLVPSGTAGDAGIAEFEDNEESKDWIRFERNNFTASSREWLDIEFEIRIPESAVFGYYWVIYITSAEAPVIPENSNELTGAVAIPVLLRVDAGEANVDGGITRFGTDKNFYEYLPVQFKLGYQNRGNVHVKPIGNIFIYDWKGKEIEALKVNEGAGNVLPDSLREFDTVWNNSFITLEEKIENGAVVKDKNGTTLREVKLHFDKVLNLRIGRYKAKSIIIVNNGEKDIPYEAESAFVVIPWKILLGLGIFVLLALIGFANTVKSIFAKVGGIFRAFKK